MRNDTSSTALVASNDLLTPPDLADSYAGDSNNRWTLNFGPQHPATHTTLRLVLELDGERIVGCTPHIGYLHSGFEKLGESLNYNQYVTIVDRMDYSAPIYNELPWHGAAGDFGGLHCRQPQHPWAWPHTLYWRKLIN